MCFLCSPGLAVLYRLLFSASAVFFHSLLPSTIRPQMKNSLCSLAANVFDRSLEKRNSATCDIFFLPSTDRTSDEVKVCLFITICCSELHPLPKLGFLSAAPYSGVRPETTGDPSLASSMFAEVSRLARGCGTASPMDCCRQSLGCLGNILGSLMCVEGSALCWQCRGSKM